MIWTTASSIATQVVSQTTLAKDETPPLSALIAEHGFFGGLRKGVEGWREYPPHGPISIRTAHGTDAASADPSSTPA
jgi:hypothetical protein